jgi:uncharacterized protein
MAHCSGLPRPLRSRGVDGEQEDQRAATIALGPGSSTSAWPRRGMSSPHRLPQARPETSAAPVRDFAHSLRKLKKCQYLYLAETGDRGLGVFAARAFSPGDVVMMDFDGDYYEQVLSYEELRESSITLKYPLQVGRDLFRVPSGSIDDFTNHSCNPNTGIQLYPLGAVTRAIRHIAVHDEITFDYSTYLNNPYERIVCLCRDENCRGVIGNFTSLPETLQQRYLALGIVGDFATEAHVADDALA